MDKQEKLAKVLKRDLLLHQQQVLEADPKWNRLRGMLDVLEERVTLNEEELGNGANKKDFTAEGD